VSYDLVIIGGGLAGLTAANRAAELGLHPIVLEQGGDAREKISMVKFHVAETLGRIADRAVQVFGARGYSKDDPIERIYRDSRVLRIFDGTSEIHRILAAKGLLQKGTAAVLG